MPLKSKRSRASKLKFLKCGGIKRKIDENNNIEHDSLNMNILNNSLSEIVDQNPQNIHITSMDTTEYNSIKYKDASTQTGDYEFSKYVNPIIKFYTLEKIRDLIAIFFDSIKNFKSIHLRMFSTFVYVILRLIGLKYQCVLQSLFGAKSSDSTISHKKNIDFNTIIQLN